MIKIGDKLTCIVNGWNTKAGPDLKDNPKFNETCTVLDMKHVFGDNPTLLRLKEYQNDGDGTEQWFGESAFRPLDRVFAGSVLHQLTK